MAHSSSGLGHRPLTAKTRVRLPVALLKEKAFQFGRLFSLFSPSCRVALSRHAGLLCPVMLSGFSPKHLIMFARPLYFVFATSQQILTSLLCNSVITCCARHNPSKLVFCSHLLRNSLTLRMTINVNCQLSIVN